LGRQVLGGFRPLTLGPLLVAGGFLLALRVQADAVYWTTVFPSVLLIAIGMAGAVAPLTTAVLASVDKHHVGSASGLNNAVARTGGMVATALIGGVLGAAGPALLSAFHYAVVICALASVAASASAFFLTLSAPIRSPPPDQGFTLTTGVASSRMSQPCR
jgi:MFS family permease